MAEHLTLDIRGHTIEFHVYPDVPGTAGKVASLAPVLERLPDRHLAVIYPVFVGERKPGGREGGGTWPANLVRDEVMGEARSRNTGIPDEDIEQYVAGPGKGLIMLSVDRWRRPERRLKFTVMHEVGHCVDFSLGLLANGVRATDLAGMETNRCGAGGMNTRRIVEAYARYFCSPSRIFHTPDPAESSAATNRRLTGVLLRSPAFAGAGAVTAATPLPVEDEALRVGRTSAIVEGARAGALAADPLVAVGGLRPGASRRPPGPAGCALSDW